MSKTTTSINTVSNSLSTLASNRARRLRISLAMLALGVIFLVLQGWFPSPLLLSDPAGIALLDLTQANSEWVSAGWGLITLILLGFFPIAQRWPWALPLWALLCGVAAGSARAFAGGNEGGLLMLCLCGLASLGWQRWRAGGLPLLLGALGGVVGWEGYLQANTLWLLCASLTAMFVWLEHQLVRPGETRLDQAMQDLGNVITQLDAQQVHLQALQQARTRLLAAISHDLRQPLLAIRLYGGLLQQAATEAVDVPERPAPDTAQTTTQTTTQTTQTSQALLCERLLRASEDAVGMLGQFSEFSAIEQGAVKLCPESFDVSTVLHQVADQLRSTHDALALRLTVHGLSHHITSDRILLTRVIQNLAGNAVRYSVGSPRRQPACVVLAVRPHGADLVIDVLDNGRGIALDKLDLVFEPYVQLNQGGQGFGLGLAIVKGIVQQLGLKMMPVRSQLGRGTRFRLLLPAQLRAPVPALVMGTAAPLAHDNTTFTAPDLQGRFIAVLDDQAAARDAIAISLETLGAYVVAAGSSAALHALLDAEDRFPDLLLFDFDIGEQHNGIDILLQVRQHSDTCIPALLLTGRVGALSDQILPASCAVLAKPASLAQLTTALCNVLALPPERTALHDQPDHPDRQQRPLASAYQHDPTHDRDCDTP